MGYPMMAMSACFGGPMLSSPPGPPLTPWFISRHPPWRRCSWLNHQSDDGTSVPGLPIPDFTRLHRIIIRHTNDHVDRCSFQQMENDSSFWNWPCNLLHIKYNCKYYCRNSLLGQYVSPNSYRRGYLVITVNRFKCEINTLCQSKASVEYVGETRRCTFS
jgi:hypothetical protein